MKKIIKRLSVLWDLKTDILVGILENEDDYFKALDNIGALNKSDLIIDMLKESLFEECSDYIENLIDFEIDGVLHNVNVCFEVFREADATPVCRFDTLKLEKS
ncbi:hypothetical protein [Bacillus altitudinis]|uniref:hypothetical protein n=1 Tax=Bacillus altitudinis TaxID=293387 RepID=UPI002E1F0E7E|nr:hypothetical protein [Bacillus altitudinis]